MRIGIELSRSQQKFLALYLGAVALMLLYRITLSLEAIDSRQKEWEWAADWGADDPAARFGEPIEIDDETDDGEGA